MKAFRIHNYGDAGVLTYEDTPMPEPGPEQVRVKLEASGLNFIDIYQRIGQFKIATPFVPGLEGAGTVDAVGPGVTEFRTGDRVAYSSCPNSYAEYVVARAARLVKIPDDIATASAAAVMIQGLTAPHYLSHSTYPIRAGDKALVHAAAGGVGLLLVQMVKIRGGWVVGTVSTEEKAQLAKAAGADEVILYTQTDFESETRRLTDGAGCEVVYDSVGKTTFDKSLNCLRPRGYLVLYGQASGVVAPLDPLILNQKGCLYLTRPGLEPYIATREEFLWRANELFGWMQSGKLNVRIDQTFPLAQAADAHRYMEARRTKGKVLLIP